MVPCDWTIGKSRQHTWRTVFEGEESTKGEMELDLALPMRFRKMADLRGPQLRRRLNSQKVP